MLSVLIPAYNYNAFPLVAELHRQLLLEKIDFEIIVGDDASTDLESIEANRKIESLTYCVYHNNNTNLGRGMNRNTLVKQAIYSWILFLDCDTMPTSEGYIKKYIEAIRSNNSVAFYGGITYAATKPKSSELLRWTYGQKREALSAETRKKKPYQSTLVSNILIQKTLMEQYPFHDEINTYGFEDFVFVHQLKEHRILINQIENPVYHLNLETSELFLEKHLSALDNLAHLIRQGIIGPKETTLSKFAHTITFLRLRRLVVWLFQLAENRLRRNLLSYNPNLFLFDLYKLGYFCRIKN